MKSVLMWFLASILSFVFMVIVMFGILYYLEPEDPTFEQKAILNDDFLADTFIREKETTIDSLNMVIDDLNSKVFFENLKQDSLNQVISFQEGLISEYKNSLERSNKQNADKLKISQKMKDIAKTYEGLKVAEMKPILEQLDDKTVIGIYENMSSRNRKNIIKALSANRAAAITQWMAKGG